MSNNATTAWERTVRRREVIRLRLGQRMTAEEIAEELGWSPETIRNDFRWIDSQIEKMKDPEVFKDYMMESAMHLMEHETRDLRDADRANDEQAKHRAKQSMRSSLKLMEGFFGDMDGSAEDADAEDYIEQLPEEVKSGLEEHAAEEIENVLEN